MDVYQRLRNDHATVSALFEELEQTSPPGGAKQREIFSILRDELLGHLAAEQEVFYNALLERIDDQDLLLESFEEHAIVERLVEEVESCGPDEARWTAKVRALEELVESHVADEETAVFEAARRQLGTEEAQALGELLRARKSEGT
jgi:hemerythrin superfamily protein